MSQAAVSSAAWAPIAEVDPELWAAMEAERHRQADKIELIASENYVYAAGPRGAGLVAHEQVRRGPAGQALLRRLRARGRRRGAGPRAGPRAVPGLRARQRPAPLGRAGQHGRLLLGPPAGRPDPGHEPRPRRAPDARVAGQLLGPAVRGPRVRGRQGDGAARLRRDRRHRRRGASQGDRRRCLGLPADVGLRAAGLDRARRRRAAVRGHGARRGARRRGAPPEPVPARGPRHDHDPQDAARTARRRRVRPRRSCRTASTAPTSRRSARTPWPRRSTRACSRASRAAR